MTSLAYFAGSFIPLDKLVEYVLQFGIFALVAVVGWFAIPVLVKSIKAKFAKDVKES